MKMATLLWSLILASAMVPLEVAAQPASRPNVLVIMVDDLGYGDLGAYGAKDLRTPHLDALAKRGVRWTQFYANAPVCSPSRAALMTGQYPDLAGVPGVIRTHPDNSWGWLTPGAKMLPAVLRQTGYHTAIVGKWHLGLTAPDTPLDRGFDHFHGFLGDMMDDYYTHLRHGQNYMRSGRQVIEPKGHATDLFTAWAVDYLRSRQGKADPFFLYLAYNAPHDPIQPPAEWVEKVRQREPGMSAKRLPLAALIEHMDHGIGEVLGALEATGLDKKTLVLMTSDNGGVLNYDANNGPYRGAKQDLYEGGIRVPLIAAWPGRIAPGTESARVGLTMDLYATICEAAGAPVDRRVDGVSLLPALLGKEGVAPTRDLFWMRREGGARYRGQDYYAVRRGLWKLLHNSPFEPMQLFHRGDDPRETTDRSASEPELVRDLTAALQLHLQRAGAVPWQRPTERPRSGARPSRP